MAAIGCRATQRVVNTEPTQSWTVRPATVNDAEGIESVRITTWKACFRGIVSDAFLDSLTVTSSRIQQYRKRIKDTKRSALVVASSGAEVIGMGVAEPCDDMALNAGVGEVRALYVLPAWQGRSVGRELLAGLTDAMRARGYRAAVLWTLRDRPPTRRFYEANGWAFDGGEATHDWHGQVHLVRYARDLSEPA